MKRGMIYKLEKEMKTPPKISLTSDDNLNKKSFKYFVLNKLAYNLKDQNLLLFRTVASLCEWGKCVSDKVCQQGKIMDS